MLAVLLARFKVYQAWRAIFGPPRFFGFLMFEMFVFEAGGQAANEIRRGMGLIGRGQAGDGDEIE